MMQVQQCSISVSYECKVSRRGFGLTFQVISAANMVRAIVRTVCLLLYLYLCKFKKEQTNVTYNKCMEVSSVEKLFFLSNSTFRWS